STSRAARLMIAPARRAALTAIPSIGCMVRPEIQKRAIQRGPDSSMKARAPLSGIRVVLCRPSHPGNIGAAARAMKTIGLARLFLVRPKRFPDPEARAMASGALDILQSARVCADLDEALAGTAFSIALSARPRELSHRPKDARAAAQELAAAARRDEAAI